MKRVQIRAIVEVPDDTPDADIEEWAKFYLGVRGCMSGTNALADQDFSAEEVYVD